MRSWEVTNYVEKQQTKKQQQKNKKQKKNTAVIVVKLSSLPETYLAFIICK